ncbi:hypothetical protein [Rhizobium terrae]|nr:hypothetical protein [Rhizobium terrae]
MRVLSPRRHPILAGGEECRPSPAGREGPIVGCPSQRCVSEAMLGLDQSI